MYSKYTGIILKKHPLGEADELLTIFTREQGKIRAKTISSRKPTSRLGGHLESLNEIEFETAHSGKSPGSASLPILISVRASTINSYLRQNLRKFAYALVGVETLYRMTPDREENAVAYEELRKFLTSLGSLGDEELIVRRFQLNLLSCCGFGFPLTVMPTFTDKPLVSEQSWARVKQQISSLQSGQNPGRLLTDTEKVIDRFIDYVLDREIKSSKFLTEVS